MNSTCAIWGTSATELRTHDYGDKKVISSPRAGGEYLITGSAADILKWWSDADKVLLTSWLVEQRRLGVTRPEIFSHTLDEAKDRRLPSVVERADALLRYLVLKSNFLGVTVGFWVPEQPETRSTLHELLAWTSSRQGSEVVELAEYCHSQGWITHEKQETGLSTGDLHGLKVRPPGYTRLEQLDAVGVRSQQAFVAMWFDELTVAAYEEGLAPAIREAGYEPLRIDRKEHNNKIDDEIIAAIRRSRFVVADFTEGEKGARGGVYYEAGYAHGLGIPVIFTCQRDVIEKVHLDTRQYNHIDWKDPQDLQKRLVQRISATIGDGPLRKP